MMKKKKSASLKSASLLIYGGALVAWLIPLMVGFLMVDPITHEYYPNYWIFKITMFVLSVGVSFFFYRLIKKQNLLKLSVPTIFLLTSTVLDMLLLVMTFGMGIMIWGLHILPFYLVGFYGLYFIMKRS